MSVFINGANLTSNQQCLQYQVEPVDSLIKCKHRDFVDDFLSHKKQSSIRNHMFEFTFPEGLF